MILELDKLAILDHLQLVQAKIKAAAVRANRDSASVALIVASKKQTVESMLVVKNFLVTHNYPVIFGENYVQEFINKKAALGASFKSHLIGALQRNKTKLAVQNFDLIQSVHSQELALALNRAASDQKLVKEIYLQVNISNDPNKAGFAVDDVKTFVELSLPKLSNLKFAGLMTITRDYAEPELARMDYRAMRELRNCLSVNCAQSLDLSMGMSSDFEVAIEEGATHIRLGSAIFGART